MYTLLIVDDEPELANGLYEMFQSLTQPELIVYKAYSAREALELLDRAKIDIIITDIRMPGMTGLDLYQCIKERWTQCKVIFLTGYMDFDYVYTAVQNQGIRYLLKTEEDEKIIDAVTETIHDIEKCLKEEKTLKNAIQHMDLALPLLQKQFFQDIIDGMSSPEEITQEKLEDLSIPLDINAEVLLLIGRLDNRISMHNNSMGNKLLYELKSISENYIPDCSNKVSFVLENELILWILQPCIAESSQWERYIISLKGNLEYIQNTSRVTRDVTISFILGAQPFILNDLYDRFYSLKQALTDRTVYGKEMILTGNSYPNIKDEGISKAEDVELQKAMRRLGRLKLYESYLESGNKKEFITEISNILVTLRSIRSKNSASALEIFYSIVLLLLGYMNKRKLEDEVSRKIDVYKMTRIGEFTGWVDAVDYLYLVIEIIFETKFNTEEKKIKDSVSLVHQYINTNLKEDLSLVRLADMVGLNASYLSRLFKEVTGKNISEFIQETRIEKAKELLCNHSRKINEISCQVGYDSSRSFTRFFKSIVGMTPQEYRESINK